MNPPSPRKSEARCTLLQLVSYLTSLGASEQQTIDTVLDLIRSGRVRLTGSFREGSLWSAVSLDRGH